MAMREAITSALTPKMGSVPKQALSNERVPRRRVQKLFGECLTSDEAIRRLEGEVVGKKKKSDKGKCDKSKTSTVLEPIVSFGSADDLDSSFNVLFER